MRRFPIKLILLLIFTLNTLFAFAAEPSAKQPTTLQLYEQPDAKSKVVAEIKVGEAIIPIFQQKDWLKLADPRNGNVGWVQQQTLQKIGMPIVYTRTLTQANRRQGEQDYKVVHYYSSQPLDTQQINNNLQMMHQQQRQMQQLMNGLLLQNKADLAEFNRQMAIMNATFPQDDFTLMPILQPVIILPVPVTTSDQNAQTKPVTHTTSATGGDKTTTTPQTKK